MRTDVKVGLVCVLILVIAVISYFALQNKPKDNAVAQNNSRGAGPASPPTVVSTPASAMPPTTPAPGLAAGPANDAPALGFHQPTSLGQVPTPYSPPGGPTTAPAGGSTLYPPGSPRGLLPPTGPDASSTGPTSVPPLTSGGMSTPGSGTPSLPGPGTPGGRPGDPEPYHPSDPLLETGRSSAGTSIVPGPSGNTYMVQSGETLTSIARKNNTTVSALKAANPSINPDRLKLKQVINLPVAGSSTPSTPSFSGATTRPSRGTATTRPSRPSGSSIAPGSSYTVKKGDTLRKIAKAAYGDEKLWARIFRVNRGEMSSADDLEPGMVLKIPAK